MLRRTLVLLSAVALASFACMLADTEAGASPDCEYDFSAVDRQLQAMVRQFNLPGCSLQVTHRGTVVFERSYGSFDLNTSVPIASATEWMSAALVMSLVSDGLLSLDDTTGRWLGWTDLKGTITLRQLMSHTSGIAGGAAPCLNDERSTLEACTTQIQTLPLIGAPGAQFVHGGNSMQVAGRICELAGGRPFADLFMQRVGGLLKMDHTVFNSATNPGIAAGASTTLRDYGRLVQMILNRGMFDGSSVLPPQFVDAMLSDQARGVPVLTAPPCAVAFRGYGVGNRITAVDDDGQPAVNAAPGAFRFTPWIDRERHVSGVFLAFSARPSVCSAVEALQQLVNEAVDRVPVGDINCDSAVNIEDLLAVMQAWGPCPPLPSRCRPDLDESSEVNIEDVLIVLTGWT